MNIFHRAAKAKQNAEMKLQGFGQRINRNIAQGQKDLRSGKIKRYQAINPFK